MSSDWIVVDVDSRVYLENSPPYLRSPSTKQGIPLTALSVLCTDELIDGMLKGPFAPQHAAPLFRLPPELLDDILRLLNPTDRYIPAAFLFALTCKLGLALARRRIVRLQQRHYAPLAGHRLVCVGDAASAHPGSYPEGLFTEDEIRTLFPGEDAAQADDTPRPVDTVSFYALAKSWQRYEHCPGPLVSNLDLCWRPSAVSRMSTDDFRRLRSLGAPCYPEPTSWVLCSITKREYIRADAVRLTDQQAADSVVRDCKLLRLLLVCICWSPAPRSVDTPPKTPMEEQSIGWEDGRWAGDRVELTTMARLRGQAEGEGPWTDVTDDVLRLDGMLRESVMDEAP